MIKRLLCLAGLHTGKESVWVYDVTANEFGITGSADIQHFECCGRVYIKKWLADA